MRSKIDVPELFSNNNAPGPGTCTNFIDLDELETMSKNGKYLTSKNKSNISYKIHNSPTKYDNSKSLHVNLGPGSYETGYSGNGKQLLSKKKSEIANTFNKRVR